MKKLLMVACLSEAATGVALLAVPSGVGPLLFGGELTSIAVTFVCLSAIALIALGVACWPGNLANRGLYGMLTFGLLAMLYLTYVGVSGVAGILLWPAVAAHAGLSILSFARGGKIAVSLKFSRSAMRGCSATRYTSLERAAKSRLVGNL